jgi:hypothetical protein
MTTSSLGFISSSPAPRTAEAAPNDENGDGWKTSGENRRVIDDANRTAEGSAAAMWRAWIEWRGGDELPPDRRQSFDRQAKALASGEDLNAWTHPVNGAIVRSGDRLRIFKLGLEHLQDMTSRTLRGGVMYAVTKCYRTPKPIPGTEYAVIVARGLAGEEVLVVAGRSALPPPWSPRRRSFGRPPSSVARRTKTQSNAGNGSTPRKATGFATA